MKVFVVILICFISFTQNTYADVGQETGLEIPRYVSLKSNDANIRVGPSKNYPIEIKYIKKNFPLKVLEEYEEWRKVEDFQKNIGWIHKSLISGTRTGIVLTQNNKSVEITNSVKGKIIGELGGGNIIKIISCKIDWCLISLDNYRGWVNKINIWGIEEKEIYKIYFFQKFKDLYWKSINFINE